MPVKDRFGLAAWVEESIKSFVKNSPENCLNNGGDEPAWDTPLVGFSRGDDPLYEEIKASIGSFYWTPLDVFRQAYRELRITADQLTVVSWILPQTKATKSDNRKETKYGSERWLRSRKFGEAFNVSLRNHVVAFLSEAGYTAIAPQLSPQWAIKKVDSHDVSSTWSERHAAYVSGLGTFGLCDGLITPVGKAIRCGSVVARFNTPASIRSYKDHHEYCLFYTTGTCGKCITRCPANALSPLGHDKIKCQEYLEQVIMKHSKDTYNLEAYGCGLCQTKVPCESRIPTTKRKS
jgi:epoxyqueuosine reductase